MTTIAFDVYGTLIDTAGIVEALREFAGDRAPLMAGRWRDKQLEYSFRRAVMRDYVDFAVCTKQALDFNCSMMGVDIPIAGREALLGHYRRLPAFDDALPSLRALQGKGMRLFAFSNGRADDVEQLLQTNELRGCFEGVVSLQAARTFKPDPGAYNWFLQQAKCSADETWLVSGNPFDVLGSLACGFSAAWLRRSADAVFDPWERAPTIVVDSLIAFGSHWS